MASKGSDNGAKKPVGQQPTSGVRKGETTVSKDAVAKPGAPAASAKASGAKAPAAKAPVKQPATPVKAAVTKAVTPPAAKPAVQPATSAPVAATPAPAVAAKIEAPVKAPEPVKSVPAAQAATPVSTPEPAAKVASAAPTAAPAPVAPAASVKAMVAAEQAAPAATPTIPSVQKENPIMTTVETAMHKTQTMFTDMNDRAKQAMEKNAKLVEEMNDLAKGNVEAVVESTRIAAKGIEVLGQEAAEYSRKSFEQASAMMKSLAAAKSPTEFMKVQSDFFRTSFDTYVAEASKHTEAMLKLAGDAAQPISSRVAVAAEKIKVAA